MEQPVKSFSLTRKTWYFMVFAVILAFLALTWANFRFAEENPGGNDFLVHWVGSRSFIFKGQSPYSDETAKEIHMMVYGRPAQEGEHELRVVYPLYSGILFAPFSLVGNYPLARALWMSLLEISILLIGALSIQVSRWQPKLWLMPIFLLFALFWYHGLRALINGNAVVVVTLLILWAFYAIREKSDVVAGFALAFATIKPHLMILLIAFIIFWAFSHRRWTLIGWIFGWLFFFILLGVFFIPDWLFQNAWEILRFSEYNPALSIGSAFVEWWPGIGLQLKWGLLIFLIILTLTEWWAARGKNYNRFLWTACLTLTISQWIGIATDPGNFILLFIPLVLIFTILKERWGNLGDWITLGIMILLFVGLWVLFLKTLEYGYQPQQSSIMFVPMPVFVLVGLYWARWWIIRPNRIIPAS